MSQFAFRRTGDADYPRYLKVLVMGPPKSGKTTFIASAPNVVVADVEAGLMSIAHLNVPYVTVDGSDKLQSLQLCLKDPVLRKRAAQQMGLPDIESVAIDTLDALQEIIKKEVLASERRTQMQQADWGKLKEQMNAMLKSFVALPMNVIFTVHTTTTQDEESRQIYAPGLQGSIKDEIAGLVDFSLLSFRQKETASDGTTAIKYYLKNEGDLKNPHLGNRAAGRLPEICEPKFSVLHRAVFADLSLPSTAEYTAQGVTKVTTKDSVAQSESQGVPEDDSDQPINAAGLSAVTKAFQSADLIVPPDLREWTLGRARTVARIFPSVKTDIAAGKGRIEDLYEALKSVDAFHGKVQNTPAKPPTKAVKGNHTPKVETVDSGQPEAEAQSPTPEEAISTVEKTLGAKVIGQEVSPDAACEECSKKIDDVNIANLAVTRFQKIMCVEHYLARTRA